VDERSAKSGEMVSGRRHARQQKFFHGEGNVDILLIFSGCWRCNANGLSQNTFPFLPGL